MSLERSLRSGDAITGPPRVETASPVDTARSGFTGPFFQAIGKRKLDGRDAKILVTAKDAQTGIGKSNLCDFLGYVLDTTEEGFRPQKITIEPEEFFSAYSRLAEGSALVMEEGEQLDPRRAMSNQNVEASHRWQMERVREIVALINLPSPKFIDNRMEELADFWLNVHRRGYARIYEKKIHDIEGYVYYETMQGLEWPNMDGSKTFREMGSLKQRMLDGEIGEGEWMPPAKHREALRSARDEAAEETRDSFLAAAYNESELTAADIADWSCVDVSASRIRQIANETT